MGTTAQKLEYLGTTKSQLKDMINYGLDDNNKITNSTTFRNYVSSIFNAFLEALRTPDTLFTNLPKITGSGSNITLNDTANAPMRIELGASELTQDGTPTPDSPQDIHTISGDNKVVVNGKNLFDGRSITQSTYVYPCKIGDTFTLSFTGYTTSGDKRIFLRTTNEPFTTTINSKTDESVVTITETSASYSLTVTSTINGYVYIRCGGGCDFYVLSNIQVEKSSTATTYEPYISQEADIDLGVNLFNATTTNVGKYLDASGNLQTSSASNTTDYIEVEENNIYTLSYDYTTLASSGTRQLCFYNSSKTFITSRILLYSATDKTNSFMTIPNAKYIRITYDKNCNNISVFKGTLTPLEYCKIGNYEDKFIRNSDGTWQLEKNIGKVVLDENSTLYLQSINSHNICNFRIRLEQNYYNSTGYGNILVNRFPKQFTPIADTTTEGFLPGYDGGLHELALWLRISTDRADTDNEMKQWLQDNETIVYYILSTPTYTKITGTLAEQLEYVYQKLLSYSGTTNISQINNDLSFNMSVQAIEV